MSNTCVESVVVGNPCLEDNSSPSRVPCSVCGFVIRLSSIVPLQNGAVFFPQIFFLYFYFNLRLEDPLGLTQVVTLIIKLARMPHTLRTPPKQPPYRNILGSHCFYRNPAKLCCVWQCCLASCFSFPVYLLKLSIILTQNARNKIRGGKV